MSNFEAGPESYVEEISECCLYRTSRNHTFCNSSCSETLGKPGQRNSCPLCRQFFKIPFYGFGGLPRRNFIKKLIDLHGMHLKGTDKLTKFGKIPHKSHN